MDSPAYNSVFFKIHIKYYYSILYARLVDIIACELEKENIAFM